MKSVFALSFLFISQIAFAKVSCNVNTGHDLEFGTILASVDPSTPKTVFLDTKASMKVVEMPDLSGSKDQAFVTIARQDNKHYSVAVGRMTKPLTLQAMANGLVDVDHPLSLIVPERHLSIICFDL